MNPIRKNIIANFIGSSWIALMNLIFIPIYIDFIGIEAYGLIGFYTILLAIFSVLDMGLSTTVNRELARCVAFEDQAEQKANLVRTLEVIYWIIGGVICLIVLSLSGFIANKWIEGIFLSPKEIQQSVMIMGLVIAVQWPLSFYQGGLIGLEDQVLLNKVSASLATIRSGGAVLILWLHSPTIQAFFIWQIITSIFEVILLAVFLWKRINPLHQPRFQINILKNIWRFAAGISGITLVTLLLTNSDKIILSKMLPLEKFGYYSFAFSVAGVIYRVTNPIFTALFPNFSKLVAMEDRQRLTLQYSLGCQLVSVIIFPLAFFIAFFSKTILLLWTRDPTIVENTYILLTFLVIGTALNGLMYIPYAIELAHGWTKLTFYKNLIALVVLVPLMVILVRRYQAIGAAIIWIILNGSYVLFEPIIITRRFLKNEVRTWYIYDVGFPLVASLAVVGIGYWLIDGKPLSVYMMGSLAAVLGFAIIAAILSASQVRGLIFSKIR